MADIEITEIPVSAPSADITPLENDFLGGLSARLNLPDEASPVEGDAPPPVVETPVPAVKSDRPEARDRIAAKELKQKVEAYEKELEELRPLRTRVTELDTSLTETKTLAEQRAAERDTLEKAYRNEAEFLPDTVINELPEVREAMAAYNKAERSLFPATLNDPTQGEPVKRFDPAKLNGAEGQRVAELIKKWEHEEFASTSPPDYRADVQHIIVSHIAKILGVNSENFIEKTVGGQIYNVIPPTHPVYNQIAMNLNPYVEARNAAQEVRQTAAAKAQESVGTIVTQRVENSRKMFADMGVTLQGDALKSALAASPDNVTLKALSLLHEHEDLTQELRDATELELMANGHLRPNFDLSETDPKARTEKANALKARIGLRAINAPLATPLKKLVIRQAAKLAEMGVKLAAAEAEASKTRQQSEPGAVIPDDGDHGGADDPYANLYAKLGLK